jgi:hypothetical protein
MEQKQRDGRGGERSNKHILSKESLRNGFFLNRRGLIKTQSKDAFEKVTFQVEIVPFQTFGFGDIFGLDASVLLGLNFLLEFFEIGR